MVFLPYVGVARFGVFSVFIMLFFVAAIGFFIALIIKSLFSTAYTHRNNNSSPVLTVHAAVVSKRLDAGNTSNSYYVYNNNRQSFQRNVAGNYYVTFEVESGDRLEFYVDHTVFDLIAEDDVGRLTFKGNSFIRFERTSKI